jgi:hypothetical protein
MALAPVFQSGPGLFLCPGSSNTGVTTISNTTPYVDANLGSIYTAQIGAEWLTSVGQAGQVLGIAGGGLTWQRRSRSTIQYLTATFSPCWQDNEVWWAYSAAAQAALTVTATFSTPGGNAPDAGCIQVGSWTGFTGATYPTNPWDGNGSLPAYSNFAGSGSTTSAPTGTLSTTALASAVIGFGFTSNSAQGTPASGFTYLTPGHNNTSNVNQEGVDEEYQLFASAQSGLTVSYPNAVLTWSLIGDALAQVGGPVAASDSFALPGVSMVMRRDWWGEIFGAGRKLFRPRGRKLILPGEPEFAI